MINWQQLTLLMVINRQKDNNSLSFHILILYVLDNIRSIVHYLYLFLFHFLFEKSV